MCSTNKKRDLDLLLINPLHGLSDPLASCCNPIVEAVPNPQATAFQPFLRAFLALRLGAVTVYPSL